MLRLLRIALLLGIAFLMIGTVVIGLGTHNTGPMEKIVLVAFGVMLVVGAGRVHKIGAAPQ